MPFDFSLETKRQRLISRLTRANAPHSPTVASHWLRSRVDTTTRRALMDELFPTLRGGAIAA
jgi:hypothetical protein